jgi:hypothetical protein
MVPTWPFQRLTNVADGVIVDRGSGLCRAAHSALPRKLTSGPSEKLVATGHEQTTPRHLPSHGLGGLVGEKL